MKAKVLLRISSGLMFFHLLGHTYGHSTWRRTTDPVKQSVINAMTQHKFPFMGAERALGDYYEGYGWAGSIALFLFGIILWLVSGSLAEAPSLARKIIIALALCMFAWSIDEFVFFFAFAACNTLLAAILAVIALFRMRR